jgi:cell division protein ZapA
MTCRVVTSATDEELVSLAAMVDERLTAILKSGRPVTKQALALVAVALAHEVTEERQRARAIADRARTTLSRLLERVDGVLATSDDLALERHGNASAEARPKERPEFREDPRLTPRMAPVRSSTGRKTVPDVTAERLRDVVRVDKARPRPLDKERGRE